VISVPEGVSKKRLYLTLPVLVFMCKDHGLSVDAAGNCEEC